MLAATWPTFSLSMPLTMMRVAEGTSKVTPSGASTLTGWLEAEGQLEGRGPLGVAR